MPCIKFYGLGKVKSGQMEEMATVVASSLVCESISSEGLEFFQGKSIYWPFLVSKNRTRINKAEAQLDSEQDGCQKQRIAEYMT